MTISARSRAALGVGLADFGAADEICDMIDADSADTLSEQAVRVLNISMGKEAAADFISIVEAADGTIAGGTYRRLQICCADKAAADEINDAIVANVD